MQITDFDYDLPQALIAQKPADPRGASRMMVLDPKTGHIVDSQFKDFPDYLRPSDVLVLNDTRVLRARTHGRLERKSGTSREIEVFFVEPFGPGAWQVLCKPGRRIRPGDRVIFGGKFCATFQESLGTDLHLLELDSAEQVLNEFGEIPLPPYIHRPVSPSDESSYQTVFGVRSGAVAAPTAGLHFTPALLDVLEGLGVDIVKVTLHVGIGTFLPIRSDNPTEHVLRPERYEVKPEAAARLQIAMAEGRRIIAVGTTTTRTLEFLMLQYGEIRAGAGYADLYILPGFQFRIVKGLLTNFHLPRSTLLMLVSAFAGRQTIRNAYEHAIRERYRFYSYGDCMLIQENA